MTFDLSSLAISEIVCQAAERWPTKTALIFDDTGETLTFYEIKERSEAIANSLAQMGVQQGDRVALMFANSPAFPLVWLALAKLGGVAVPINTFNQQADTRYILEASNSKFAVAALKFIPLLESCARGTKVQKIVRVVEQRGLPDDEMADTSTAVSTLSLRLDASATTLLTLPPVNAECLMNIQFTSGTTGKPKGCRLSQRYWTFMGETMMTSTPRINYDDVLLTAQPFHYMDPVWNFTTVIMSGATLVVLDRFHPSSFWEKVREYRVTTFYCLGMMAKLLMKMPKHPQERQHFVRLVMCSGIGSALHADIEARWGVPWIETYGSTECGVVTMEDLAFHTHNIGAGCMGSPVAGREIRIVDNQGNPVPTGSDGRLLVSGIHMMQCYDGDSSAASTMANGWFDTGDIVRVDDVGQLYFVGRTKEMIRRSGENISALEVEEVLAAHPQIKLNACVAVPDDLRGEEIAAFISLNPQSGESISPTELAKFCSQQLAYFKVPRYWIFQAELPVTSSGKIQKSALLAADRRLPTGTYDLVQSRFL